MAIYTEEELLLKRLERKMGKAVEMYRLIEDGDRILVGLSGGKDSLALIDLLGRRMRIFKPRFTVVAVHVSMSNIPYQADLEYLRNHTEKYGIPFIHHQSEFDATGDRRKSPCFLCSWTRRKALFALAKEHGCNKMALGHHQDDVLQTLLLNMTHQGAFGTMPPKLRMNKFDMTIIRPLCLIQETDLMHLSDLLGYVKQKKNCPYESSSSRPAMKEVVKLLEQMNPMARQNLWGSMTNVQTEYLPVTEIEK